MKLAGLKREDEADLIWEYICTMKWSYEANSRKDQDDEWKLLLCSNRTGSSPRKLWILPQRDDCEFWVGNWPMPEHRSGRHCTTLLSLSRGRHSPFFLLSGHRARAHALHLDRGHTYRVQTLVGHPGRILLHVRSARRMDRVARRAGRRM